jgi:hypothetical protein
VLAVDVVEEAVVSLGDDRQAPEAAGERIGARLVIMVGLLADVGIGNRAHAVSVADENGTGHKSRLFEPRGSGHFTFAVEGEPAAEGGIVRLLTARPDNGDASAN